jgi:retron-type reverse transcriptase
MTAATGMPAESPVHGNMHAGFGGAGRGNGPAETPAPRPASTLLQPSSYGFRPGRRAQDAIAEIHYLASRSYEWVLEGDITACFDEIDHSALLDRVRHRIADKRVLGLVKAFCKAGILVEDGAERDTIAGTPQGGILTPPTQ